MSIRFWIRNLFARPAVHTIRKAPRRFGHALEGLEDRWVPTNIVVNTILDNVNDAIITGPTVTLREAINYGNANGGASITFDPNVFNAPQTITLDGTQLELSNTTGTDTITGSARGRDHQRQRREPGFPGRLERYCGHLGNDDQRRLHHGLWRQRWRSENWARWN